MYMESKSQVVVLAGGERRFPVPIRTPRLELRPFRESDAECMVQLFTDPVATQYIGGVRSREEALKLVPRMRDAFAGRGFGTLAVSKLSDGHCIGYCGVRPLAHTEDVEIAFAFHREHWNLGYATEAASACVDAAFVALGVEWIVGTVYPDNLASRRVLKKLGMDEGRPVFGNWPRDEALLLRLNRESWRARVQANGLSEPSRD